MSESISPTDALAAVRRGEKLPAAAARKLGEEHPSEFFRVVIEGLADSFEPSEAAAYEQLMRTWIPERTSVPAHVPERVDTVYVLSRVTLGADIKITSVILDAMKKRFSDARIVFVSGRKSAEMFVADTRIGHVPAEYPRAGPVSARIEFAHALRKQLDNPRSIVIDPDSRMTQLGLIPVCDPNRYFHFPSRTADGSGNLTELVQRWLAERFCVYGEPYIAAGKVSMEGAGPRAAISFGVGENEAKRLAGEFEAAAIRILAAKFPVLWVDRGAGGEEARRVTAAAEASGAREQIRFWEGSFAGFASIISQSDFYAGYDSAGQHAAAAAGVPLVTFFRGAPRERFRQRWSPYGHGQIEVINADSLSPDTCLERLSALLE